MQAILEGRNDASGAFRQASLDARELGRELDRLDGRNINLDARLSDHASTDLKTLDQLADRLDGRNIELDARLSDRASDDIARLEAVVNKLDGRDIDLNVDVDSGGGLSNLKAVDTAADRLDGRDINMDVDVDTGGAVTQLVAAERAANTAGSSFDNLGGSVRSAASTMRGAGLIAIVGAIAAGLYILGPAVQAAGGGLVAFGALAATAATGVGLLAAAIVPSVLQFKRFAEAQKEAEQASKEAESAAKSYESAQQSLADANKRVADAERGVADARRNATEQVAQAEASYEDALRGVTDAERQVADAERAVADARRQSAEQVEQAEESLQSAREDLTNSTEDLRAAQEDLNAAERDEPLNRAEAVVDLADARDRAADAQKAYNEAIKEYGVHSEEAEDAARDLIHANIDLQRQEQETQDIRKHGSEELQNAKEGVKSAYDQQKDSAQSVRDAEDALAQARADGARQVKEAQRGVADAQRGVTEAMRAAEEAQAGIRKAQADGARQVRDAQRGVADAQEAAARAADDVADAAKKMAEAQAAAAAPAGILSDANRRLMNTWIGVKDAFEKNDDIEHANDTLADLGTTIGQMVRRALPSLAEEADETATSFAKSFQRIRDEAGGTERNSLNRILESSSDILGTLTRSVGRFGQGLVNLLGSGPAIRGAKDLAGWFEDISEQFRDWSRTEKARDGVADWLDRARTVGRGVRDAFGSIAESIGRFGDKDAENAADAIRGIGRATAFMIDEIRKTGREGAEFIEWLDDASNKADKLGDRLSGQTHKTNSFWHDLTDPAVTPTGVGVKLEKWMEHLGDKTLEDLNDALGKNSNKVNTWWEAQEEATSKSDKAWNHHIAQNVFGWLTDFNKKLDSNESKLEDWAKKHGAKTEDTQHNWKQYILDGIVDAVLPNLSRALGDSATDVDTWADKVKGILGSIMDFLGIEHGSKDSKGAKMTPNTSSGQPGLQPAPSQSGHPGLHADGGIYQGHVRMMASGGFVDSSGVYTAITTGMDRALSRGSVWHAATGGVSDGLTPRVVYGEGRPGEGAQEEGYLPRNLEYDRALPILSTMAEWFNMGLVPLMAEGGMLPPRGGMAAFGTDKILQYTATAGAEAVAGEGARMWRGLVQPGGRENIVSISNLGGNLRGLSYADGRTYLDPLAKSAAAAHEFGHHLGLGHGGHSIMGGAGFVTPEDFAALRAYYGITPPGRSGSGSGGLEQGGWGSGAVNITNIHMTSSAGGEQSVRTYSSQGGSTMPHGAHAADYPSMQRWMFRNPAAGMIKRMLPFPRFMQSGGIYPVNSGNVYPDTWQVASDIAGTFNYLNEPGTTYAGHGADGDAMNSVDFEVAPWGTVAQGAQFQTGEAIKNRLQSKWANMTDYIIWNKMANYGNGWETYKGGGGYAPPSDPSSYHQDHVHEEVLHGPGSGIASTGGGSGGFDVLGWIENQLQRIPSPDLGNGPYFEKLGPGMKTWAISNIMDWAEGIAGSLGFSASPSASGGLEGWAKSGLQYGNVIEATPSNIQKIVTLANKESGGDPRAHNPSGASGLMQMMPATFDAYNVANSDSIWNPVHNVAASSRYQKDRYGNLITFSPYTAGGIALQPQLASVAERGPEFFMPLDQPESARRFLNLLEGLHSDRVTREHRMPDVWDSDTRYAPTSLGPSNAALIREVRAMREQLKNVGIDPDSQVGIGDAAATGTIQRAKKDPRAQADINHGQNSYQTTMDDLGGRRKR